MKNSFENLKLNCVISDLVNFLDLYIYFDNITNSLKFFLYIKPTNAFSYLLPISNHPPFICKNIPKNLLIRIRRICSYFSDFLKYANKLIFQLLDRGYDFNYLKKMINIIGNVDRSELLPYKKVISPISKATGTNYYDSISFKIPYDCNFKFIKNSLKESFNGIIKKKDVYKYNDINTLFSVNLNISSLFVHRFKYDKFGTYFCKKCESPGCKLCDLIYDNTSYILLNNFVLPIMSNTSCLSTMAIYIIHCSICNVYYVGQSKNIKQRFANHLSCLRNFIPYISYNSVSRHFNLNTHKGKFIKEYFRFFVIESDIIDLDSLRKKEAIIFNLIFRLGLKVINEDILGINLCT